MENKNNKLMIPAAIIVGAVIIGGTLIYTRQPHVNSRVIDSTSSTKLDYVDLADEIGLDTKQFKNCFESQKYKDEVAADLQAGREAGVESTPTSFVNGRKIIGAYPFSTFQAAIEEALQDESIPEVPGVDDDYILGDQSAPVLIVEFGDFQCPYCGDLYRGAEQEIIKNYVENGQVKLVYRDFPLFNIHPAAIPAALAAQCAGEQNAYWQYHDALFTNQDRL